MTSREKAIEALRELCKSSHCVSESLRLSLKPFEVTERKNIIYDYITQPTLDEALAVVEEYVERYNDLHDAVLLTEVLLTLKGLKEGK